MTGRNLKYPASWPPIIRTNSCSGFGGGAAAVSFAEFVPTGLSPARRSSVARIYVQLPRWSSCPVVFLPCHPRRCQCRFSRCSRIGLPFFVFLEATFHHRPSTMLGLSRLTAAALLLLPWRRGWAVVFPGWSRTPAYRHKRSGLKWPGGTPPEQSICSKCSRY